jgi:hypothetical protein
MQRYRRSRHLKIVTAFLIADIIFFCIFNPQNSSSFVTIVGCVLVSITIYIVTRMLLMVLGKATHITKAAQEHLSLSISLALTFLLLMQSIGQLGVRDLLAVIPLAIVVYFYLSYAAKRPNNGLGARNTRA